MRASGANCGQLNDDLKAELMGTLDWFVERGVFPTGPKLVPACVGGKVPPPLIDEFHPPVAEKKYRF